MEPFSATVAAALALVDWQKAISGLATDAAIGGAKSLLSRLKPDESEKAANYVVGLFTEQFLTEIEDKTPLSSAIPGYQEDLKRLIQHTAPEIAAWLQPETKEVDLTVIARTWEELNLHPLPGSFDWALVAKNFARDVRAYVRNDVNLRERLNTALLEQQTELQRKSAETLERMAGPDPGFDLVGYRDYLSKKCAVLQLSALHTSTYDRRIQLWSVFVPQSARQSVPVRNLPRKVLRHLHRKNHLSSEPLEEFLPQLHDEIYLSSEPLEEGTDRLLVLDQNTPPVPVLDLLDRERLVVILGDPGSGKTSLLKYLVLRWINNGNPPLPIWIDLKDYAQERHGFLEYCESACTNYRLDAHSLERSLGNGEAALYLDGLDEIFDGTTRGQVIEEIAAFSTRYSKASVVVTSRVIGYEPDRLRNFGFVHATLEEFDDQQVRGFLTKWHDAAIDEPKERSRLHEQLESALGESRAVRELAGNPLLLTMIAILNRTQPLPRNRVELYEQASRVLLHEWDASRSLPVDTFARQEKEELLRELAGAMQQGEDSLEGNIIDRSSLIQIFRKFLGGLGVPNPHTTATELVEQLVKRNFILCYAGGDRFSFVHRTFLEYFCALWFVQMFEKKQTLTLDELKADVFGTHWRDETWHEVLRLIAGMVGEEKAEELIRFLIEQDGENHNLANLLLAAECLSELRNRRAIRATDDLVRSQLLEQAICWNPPINSANWRKHSRLTATRGKAVSLLAGLWKDDATRRWLYSAAKDGSDLTVRTAAVHELARIWKEHAETYPLLNDLARTDKVSAVRIAAVSELVRLWRHNPEIGPILRDLARAREDFGLQVWVVRELTRSWKEDPETLRLVKDLARSEPNWSLRTLAREESALAWPDDPEVRDMLRITHLA